MPMNRIPLIIPIALLAACSEAGSADLGVLVRDSAGVVVVENSAPAWEEGEAWTIGDPTLTIGMMEGPAEYQLDQVRAAVPMSGGRIAVANGGTQEIRVYSADGEIERTLGREGGGPGEFRALTWIAAMAGDSIMAYDWRDRRVTVFAPTGEVARTVSMASDSAGGLSPRITGVMEDGSFAVQSGTMPPPGEMTGGLTRAPARVHRVGPDGDGWVPVAELLGDERMIRMDPERSMISMMVLPVFRASRSAVAGPFIYAADTDRYEIRRYQPDGTLSGLIRHASEPVPITAAETDELVRQRVELAETEAQRRIAEQFGEGLHLPPTMPAFAEMLADADGNVWVQEFVWPEGAGARWSVLSPAGRWLGDVEMPEGLRPTYIGADVVVGVWTDELDVEYVRVHELRKP